MTWTIIAILIIVGVIFVVLEILVIPGTHIVGILGFIMEVIGIWQTYVVYGSPAGHWVLAGTVVISLILLWLSLRANTWHHFMLHSNIDGRANIIKEDSVKVGDVGRSVSRIVPTGKALINDDYFEVCSSGEFIDPDNEIVVTKIEHNKIFVKIKN